MDLRIISSSATSVARNFDVSLKVLIAEDVGLMRNLMRGMLESIGMEQLELVNDGRAALAKLRNGNFDLVIADWHMPELNGLDLLCRIRADTGLKELPFLMVTSEGESKFVEAALDAGANGFLTKPISRNGLVEKIAGIIST